MNKNIVLLGVVSLLTDISSEMIYPLIPIYLTVVLGASPAALGLIEGVAESLASVLKVFSGRLADRAGRRKPLTITGYALSVVGKGLFIVATAWTGVFWARLCDRFGKGIRTAPRDALIVDSIGTDQRGRAFGLHRALDTSGAVIGIGTAYWLFTQYSGSYLLVFWLAVIPAVLGVVLLFFVHEPQKIIHTPIERIKFFWRGLDPQLKFFLLVTFLFNLGNSSNQFLLIRAGSQGFSASEVILLYFLMNVVYLGAALPSGILSDKIGRKWLLVLGYCVYGFVYIGFANLNGRMEIVGLFGIYGLYIGLTEGVEKALLADIAPEFQRATVFGLHALIVGMALLPASLLAGILWSAFGAAAPFWFGGVTGLCAAVALILGLHK